MELLLSSSSDARHVLSVEKGPLSGQYFRVQYHVCINPTCQCEHLGMQCVSAANSPSESRSSAPIILDMDLRRRVIANLKELKADRTAFSMAKAIEDEITEAQWTELRGLYVAEKRQQTERADLDQVEVQFPPEVLDGNGSMVGYYELFPYAQPIAAALDATPWILDDQYCVSPTCRCQDVSLAFLQGHSAPALDAVYNDEEITIRYAYDKGVITESHSTTASGPSAQDLLRLMKAAQPDLDTVFAERHALLRRLFRRAIAEPRPRAPVKKPGRNEACPCGSGKKYKRCCGMN
jgi:uncharacterized protein YchJ